MDCIFLLFKSLLIFNKYLYIPFESFHPSSNKKAFIKGELMRYARNSSSFASFAETREKFWKRLRVRCYPLRFLLSLFRAIRYSDRKGWLEVNLTKGQGLTRLSSLKPPLTAVTHVSSMLSAGYYQIWIQHCLLQVYCNFS